MTENKDMILLWMPTYLGLHTAVWRQEKKPRHLELDFNLIRRQIRTAERGKFHGVFIGDALAVGLGGADLSVEALSRTANGASRWEPMTLMSALAICTRHIGLLGTISTTYSQPYNVARMLASLDHISGGRAGWNVVTSLHPKSGANFGLEEHMGHAERYERGEEFFDVVAGLWDSWEDDAFVRDKWSGRYFDPEKVHALNHRGKYLSVAGPLNIARPPQGHPVIAQAGSSPPGRAFAARIGEVVYTMQPQLKAAKEFYDDVKGQAISFGRDPNHIKILPSVSFLVGHSMAHAEDKLATLDALVDPVLGMELLSAKVDLSGYPLDGPVPEVPAHHDSKTVQNYFLGFARRDNLTVRQLMQLVSRLSVIPGDAACIADMFEEWGEAGAADGFNILFANDADSLPIFVDEVIPELQRRGLFQTDYRGKTLRENLGLPRMPNRFGGLSKTAHQPSLVPAKSGLAS